jgi:flavin-binding protein dodecin
VGGRRTQRGRDCGEKLRVAEVVRQDVTVEDGQVTAYRVRLSLSFKYDPGS